MTEMLINIGNESWSVLGEMAPYILFGFLVAGILSELISPETVERHLGGKGIVPVLKATLFGIPLPLCSCGVIPVAASLRKHGASRGATSSFLLSTPQTGVDSIMVTFGLLGPVFAIFRPLVALVSGLVGGALVSAFGSQDHVVKPQPPQCQGDCNADNAGRGRFYRAFHYGFVSLPQDIARALIIGIVIAGFISALIPEDFFLPLIGTGIGAMLVMMTLGIPVYVCATASVPVAAALIAKGLSPGAALVFLMTGPATNAATIATVWKVLGRRTALIYLGTVAVSALAAGMLLDYIFSAGIGSPKPEMPWMLPGIVKTISAVALLALLGFTLFRSYRKKVPEPAPEDDDRIATLNVKGMTCNHCVNSVKRALSEGAGVDSVEVDLKSGKAVIEGKDFDIRSLGQAVEELGYKTSVE